MVHRCALLGCVRAIGLILIGADVLRALGMVGHGQCRRYRVAGREQAITRVEYVLKPRKRLGSQQRNLHSEPTPPTERERGGYPLRTAVSSHPIPSPPINNTLTYCALCQSTALYLLCSGQQSTFSCSLVNLPHFLPTLSHVILHLLCRFPLRVHRYAASLMHRSASVRPCPPRHLLPACQRPPAVLVTVALTPHAVRQVHSVHA